MVTTYLQSRYVDRAKLNALLQSLFGQSYTTEVGTHCIQPVAKIQLVDASQIAGDTISIEASRQLTEVRGLKPRRSCLQGKKSP